MGDVDDIKNAIRTVVDGGSLNADQAAVAMDQIMTGGVTPAQIGAFVTALRMRGETVEEIAGFASAMRRHALRVEVDPGDGFVVDTCGTGGDASGTFNISTTAAFVIAGAGVRVAKHGNRSVTSKCGSADLLEGLGVAIELSPSAVARCVNEVGIGFMYAPAFHPAMRFVGPTRREIGIRTVFNLLGPLTNPAGPRHHRDRWRVATSTKTRELPWPCSPVNPDRGGMSPSSTPEPASTPPKPLHRLPRA